LWFHLQKWFWEVASTAAMLSELNNLISIQNHKTKTHGSKYYAIHGRNHTIRFFSLTIWIAKTLVFLSGLYRAIRSHNHINFMNCNSSVYRALNCSKYVFGFYCESVWVSQPSLVKALYIVSFKLQSEQKYVEMVSLLLLQPLSQTQGKRARHEK